MANRIVLLRGINLGSRNRVAMPALREALASAGYEDVRTYVQSGNVVLDGEGSPEELEANCERLITERFGFQIAVVSRTRAELAEVVARDPIAEGAENPKRYQVSFLSAALDRELVGKLEGAAGSGERLVAIERELYTWHRDGVGRSKLWAAVSGKLPVKATARNWTTVTKLLEMLG